MTKIIVWTFHPYVNFLAFDELILIIFRPQSMLGCFSISAIFHFNFVFINLYKAILINNILTFFQKILFQFQLNISFYYENFVIFYCCTYRLFRYCLSCSALNEIVLSFSNCFLKFLSH